MSLPKIEGYSDLTHIDIGGSSNVYSAHDDRQNRKVAIKVLTTRSLDLTVQQAYTRELEAMRLLSDHPHILSMLDSGLTTDAAPYIVMPLYTNGSYAERIKSEGPLSWVETIDVGVKIASALQAAHDCNVLHRDVKPSNIFVGHYRADPVLGDFGISTIMKEDKTTTAAVAYTLAYVAPEVLNGGRQTRQTDIYSLGVTLRQLVAGRPAFAASSHAALIAQIVGYPPLPLMVDMPLGLNDLLDDMVSKDPADRPGTGVEVARALRMIQRSRPTSVDELDSVFEPNEPVNKRHTADVDNESQLASPYVSRPYFVGETRSPRVRLVDPVRLAGHDGSVNAIEFSPDGSRLVAASDDRSVVFWDVSTGEIVRKVEGHDDWVNSVAYNINGDMIATASDDHTIVLWDTESGREKHRLSGHTANVNSVTFSPDGSTLVSASFDGSVMLWNVTDGTHRQTLGDTLDLNSVHSVVYRSDGFALATGSFDGTLILWDAETGQKQLTIEDHTDWVTSVAFSPDGNVLASGSVDGSTIVRDAITGEKYYELEMISARINSIAFSPDSRSLVTAGTAGLGFWDVASGRKQSSPTTDFANGVISLVAFDHDGTNLAMVDSAQSATVWSLE